MKYRLEVGETVIYRHTIDFESDLLEDEINPVLDEISREYLSHHDDVTYKLKERGFKSIEFNEDEDGDTDEIEIDNLQEVKKEE